MESFEELEGLMQDTPVSQNYGRKSSDLSPVQDPTKDGLSWPRSSRHDLSLTEERDFLHTESTAQAIFGRKQSGEHGLVAHRGLLTDDELEHLDLYTTKSLLEILWDLEPGDLDEAYCHFGGSISADRRKLRSKIDQILLEEVEAGRGSHLLAMALGWRIRTRKGHRNDCPRMTRTLARARRARACT